MRWLRLNLFRKFLLTLLAVGLLPAAAGVALTARELWKVIRDDSGNRLLAEARNLAVELDRATYGFINRAAVAVARSTSLPDLFADPAATPATATLELLRTSVWTEAQTSHPLFLLPVRTPLRVFVLPPGADAARTCDPDEYRLLEARCRSMPAGLRSVNVHTDRVVGRHLAMVWLPVFRPPGDEFRGWVGIEIPIRRIFRTVAMGTSSDVVDAWVVTSSSHFLGDLRASSPTTATVARIAQLHAQLSRFDAGTEGGTFEVRFGEASRQLVGFAPLPLTRVLRTHGLQTYGPTDADWFVCIGRDMRPLVAAFQAPMSRAVLAGVGLAIVLAGLAYLFARRLTRPLQQLEAGVRNLAEGDLGSRVAVQVHDEVQNLADAFNDMASRLERAMRDLQRQMVTVQRQSDELALLHEITRSINSRLDLEQTLLSFARETARILSYDRLSVALLDDPEHFTIQFVYPEAEASEYAPGTRHRLDESDLAEAVRAGRPIVFRDVDRGPARPAHEFLAAAGLRSVMVVPLISESKAIGSVNLASRRADAFTAEEQERMAVLAEPVAVAIQHSRLYMRVRRFAEELEEEVRRRTAQLRRAQDKLVQTEKLAATGQLAAGIAHEINNPLGIIKNYLRLTIDRFRRTRPGKDTPLELQNLRIIEEEINRIARIVQNLLDLYHPRDHSPVVTDINELLERVLELFEANWAKKGIDVIRRFEPSLPPAVLSSDRMRQIIINLLRNAEDAIEDRGVLVLTTRSEPANDESETDRIVIEVEDNGCGIPAEALPRVFDPFFTTKKGAAGTGLGLSVTYGIVRSYSGTIEIDSQPGRGTRVTIAFPVSVVATAGARAEPSPPAPAPSE